MKADLLKGKVIHTDETVVQVLHEKDRKAKTQSRMWVYAAPKSARHANCLFEYCRTRNGDNAAKFLEDYAGYVVCDGYDGYNKLPADKVMRCGCWTHVRRKFVDALPNDEKLLAGSKAAEGVEWCNQMHSCLNVSMTVSTRTASESESHSARKKDTNSVRNGRNPFWMPFTHGLIPEFPQHHTRPPSVHCKSH